MKELMLTTAVLAMSTFASYAQTSDAESPFRSGTQPQDIRASDFIGMSIYAAEQAVDSDAVDGAQTEWNNIGEVSDLILTRDGSVDAVLVDIGGFLGLGEREVAVNMTSLRFVNDSATSDNDGDFFLVMTGNREVLESAPAYSSGDDISNDEAAALADGEEARMSNDPDLAAAKGTGAPVTTADGTAPANTSGVDAGTSAMATADGTTAPAAGTGTGTGPAPLTETQDLAAEGGNADGSIARDGFVAAEAGQLTTEKLTGARVYDANDTWIGDVSELVIDQSGQITSAIVDVGGFLGMGSKPVALTMADLDILSADGGDEVRVYVSMTRDQLDAMAPVGN